AVGITTTEEFPEKDKDVAFLERTFLRQSTKSCDFRHDHPPMALYFGTRYGLKPMHSGASPAKAFKSSEAARQSQNAFCYFKGTGELKTPGVERDPRAKFACTGERSSASVVVSFS